MCGTNQTSRKCKILNTCKYFTKEITNNKHRDKISKNNCIDSIFSTVIWIHVKIRISDDRKNECINYIYLYSNLSGRHLFPAENERINGSVWQVPVWIFSINHSTVMTGHWQQLKVSLQCELSNEMKGRLFPPWTIKLAARENTANTLFSHRFSF